MVLSLWPHCRCHCGCRRCLHHRQHCLCCCCRHRSSLPSLYPLLLSPVSVIVVQQWQRSNGHSDGRDGGGTAMAMAAQQRQWRCSNSLGNAAMAMAAQQRQWRWRPVQRWGWQWWWQCSNGSAAMVEAAQQWWWTEAIVEYHRIVSYSVFV